jgi:hypothetical protein
VFNRRFLPPAYWCACHCEKRRAPYASIDPLRALCGAPRAVPFVLATCDSLAEREALLRLQNELPTLWFVTPIEAWIATFGQRADKLARRLAEHGLPSGLALTITANALAQIVDLQPGLRMHTQAVFLLTCHAGDLDQTLVDRLCRRAERTLLELANDLVPGGSALRTCSQLRIEIFAPNAENDPGRASIHSLKDR